MIRPALAGAAAFAAAVAVLYAALSEEDRSDPLDPEAVDACRALARQSMDLAVEAARAGPDPADPADAGLIADLRGRAGALQSEMDALGCAADADRWAYGSFRQEMVELERYIADLQRDRAGG